MTSTIKAKMIYEFNPDSLPIIMGWLDDHDSDTMALKHQAALLIQDLRRQVSDLQVKLGTAKHDALMEAAGIVDCDWSAMVLRDMAAETLKGGPT